MFGTNPVRKAWHDSEGRLRVQSIFGTVQGEGPYAGQPAIFIRLAGCNLRCWFCDTDFESNFENILDVDRISARVDIERATCNTRLVVVTGGEPLLQNVAPLFARLIEDGYEIQVETAGTVWVEGLETLLQSVMLVCSPKTPRLHEKIQRYCKHYKYIVTERGPYDLVDGLPLATTQQNPPSPRSPILARPENPKATIWVQPCDEYFGRTNQRNEILYRANMKRCVDLALAFGYRVSLQTHKILNVE